jgi:prolyl oligopeptidase
MSDNPEWETVLDIDKLSEEENQKWVYKGASWLYPDYKRCLVYLSPGGGDAVEVREFDAEKKEFIKDGFFLPTAKTRLSWKDINTLYVGTDFGEGSLTESGYARIAKEWKRGTPLSDAKTVFEGDVKDVSAGIYVMNTPERQYVVLYRGITFFTRNTFFLEDGKKIKLDIPDDASFWGIFKNQILVHLKSDWNFDGKTYKQGNLISIDYDEFLNGSNDYSVVIAPNETSSISGTSETKNLMLVNMLNNVRSELYVYTFKDGEWSHKKIDAPDFGTLYISATDEFSDRYFFGYQDFLTPSSLFYVTGPDAKPKKIKSLPEFFDGAKFEVKQNFATSKDATKIPYFVVHPKGMKFEGNNPTLLSGYGGFEVSRRPFYSATVGNSWLEKGGVYVLANIRGGGEFGPKWHRAGLKENRQRVYDDFIAVAEDLVAKKITSPAHLGISGGSNGGLLVGVMFTQRPDLFNGVVCAVPLLDMKRYNKLLAGASWMAEYGNPDIPEEWEYIRKYSPYHNLFENKKYPKVFFTTSTRDDRVHPAHARKMAKKMENLGYEFYYFENIEGGHGGVSTNDQRAFRDGLIYSYLLKQLK